MHRTIESGTVPNIDRVDWNGLLNGQRALNADLRLIATLRPSTEGGSGAFLGLADDKRHYWIKTLNNAQGKMVPISEQIVGRAGSSINAPTCEVSTIEISEEFAGWEFKPGRKLEPGVAHASLNVDDVVLSKKLSHRLDNENARRHAFIYALYDWCWGDDVQGLLAVKDENRFYSHDHGYYLPPSGANWNAAELEARVDEAHPLQIDPGGVSSSAVIDVATALEAVKRDEILTIVTNIPEDWPVQDTELESVGFFLERHASAVAQRIKQRFGSSA